MWQKTRTNTNKFSKTQLDEDPTRTIQDLSTVFTVDKSTIGKSLHAMGMIHKMVNWASQQLKKRDVRSRERCKLDFVQH